MERVVKRYLMHSQGDSDDPKLNELEDLKQELQALKFEIGNDLKKTKDENFKNSNFMNNYLHFMGEEIIINDSSNVSINNSEEGQSSPDSNSSYEASLFKFKESFMDIQYPTSVQTPKTPLMFHNTQNSLTDEIFSANSRKNSFPENGESSKCFNSEFCFSSASFSPKNKNVTKNIFFDNFIDNFNNNSVVMNANEMSSKKGNRYKVTFDLENEKLNSRNLYKITEESSYSNFDNKS
jgi:hypothetical protein